MQEKFWMCYADGGRAPTYIHRTGESARQEAERLARLPECVGRSVYVLEATSVCKVEQPVSWNECKQLTLPEGK